MLDGAVHQLGNRAGRDGGGVPAHLEVIVGQQATKAAKNTKTFSKIVDKLDRNGKLTQANRYLDATKASAFGVDDCPQMTGSSESEQSNLFTDAPEDQQTLTSEQAAGQCLFEDEAQENR